MSRTFDPEAERLYQQAQEQFSFSNYEADLKSLQQVIAIQPDSGEVWYLRGLS